MPLPPAIGWALFILYARHCDSSWQHTVQISAIRSRNPVWRGTYAFGLWINIDSANNSKPREKNEQSEYRTAEIKPFSPERKKVVSTSWPSTFGMLLHSLIPSSTAPSPGAKTTYGFPRPCVALKIIGGYNPEARPIFDELTAIIQISPSETIPCARYWAYFRFFSSSALRIRKTICGTGTS